MILISHCLPSILQHIILILECTSKVKMLKQFPEEDRLQPPHPVYNQLSDSCKLQMELQQKKDNQVRISGQEKNKLLEAHFNFKQFIREIGPLRYPYIRKDILEHCDKLTPLNCQSLNFERVEHMLKNRIDKILKNKKLKKNWSQQDILILVWILSKYCQYRSIDHVERQFTMSDWEFIASLIPGSTPSSCMFKWLSLKSFRLADNGWTAKESQLLESIVNELGSQDWGLISQELYLRNRSSNKIFRCAKQCRERWSCYLNPNLKKGPWQKQEDILLLRKVVENKGHKKWAEFVKQFNGRTQNALKNRYSLLLDKQRKEKKTDENMTELELIQEYLHKVYVEQFMNPENQHLTEPTSIKGSKLPLYHPTKAAKKTSINLRSKTNKLEDEYILESRYRSPNKIKKVKKLRKAKQQQAEEDNSLVSQYQSIQIHLFKDDEIHEQYRHQSLPHESLMHSNENHFIRSEFSDFTPAKAEVNNYFVCDLSKSKPKNEADKEESQNHHNFLSSVDHIQIVPFDFEQFEGMKAGGNKQLSYVPCQIRENRLIKFQDQKQ